MTVPKTRKVYDGSLCGDFGGRKRRTDQPCTQPAGWGTDHAGTGRCKLHGGANTGRPIEHGKYSRYAVLKSKDVAKLREHFEADPDPLDLKPDVIELRVRIADFCDRYDEMTAALLAWHASYSDSYALEIQTWRRHWENWEADYKECLERVRELRDTDPALAELEDPPLPPKPDELSAKPRRVVDILQVAQFIGMLGGLVDKIKRREDEKGFTVFDINEIIKQHGVELMAALKETVDEDELRSAILAAVADRWDIIPIAKTAKK